MFRIALMAIAVCGVCGFFIDSAFAQKVVVKRKPAPQVGKDQFVEYDEWVVSFSRNNGPTVFELDSFHKTEGDARKRADKLISWSHSIQGNGWKLAVIEIEGDPSVRDKNPRKKDGSVDLPDLKLSPNRKLGDVLREYSKVLEASYENAKKAKDEAIARTTSLTQKEFDSVNKLVDGYNKQREDVRAETGYYFSQFQLLSPVARTDLMAPIVADSGAPQATATSERTKPSSDTPLQSNAPRGGPITTPDSYVDPGPMRSPVLKGKRYVGQINGDDVTLDFGDSEVQFSGGRVGDAKYSVLTTKLAMQSKRTKYIGTIDGNKITGTFERLDGSEKGSWSMQLSDAVTIQDLVGDWTYADVFTLRFESDGTVSYRGYAKVTGRVSINGNRITFSTDEGWTGKHGLDFTGTLVGGELRGTISYHTKAVGGATDPLNGVWKRK